MVKISIIDSLHAQKDQRLDAEYYKPEFLEVLDRINRLKCKKLRKLVKEVIGGPFGSTILVTHYIKKDVKKGVPFIRVADVKDIFIRTSDLVYVNPFHHKNVERFILQAGDIVISRVGTLGLFSLLTDDYGKWFLGSNLIAIKSPFKMNKYFLLIFLNSKYGKFQILRSISGQVQGKITTRDVENMLVPQLVESFQFHIEQLVKQAYEKMKLAEQKYLQAEELLYKLLGITKEEIEKLEEEKGYETNFKNVAEAFRFDAEYYHPKHIGIIELLKKSPFEINPLKEVVEISNEKIDSTNEKNKNKRFRYVPIAKINESGEIFEWDEFYGWQAPSRARMLVKENDIVIPSLAGTFDKIALVPRELDGQLTTTGCFVVRVKDDYPEFLFLLLRTPLFKRQLEQQTTGAIMSAVPKSVFGDLLIPKIPKDKQKEIVKLVREYFDLRKEARGLIRRAIKKVEEEIEHASNTRAIREQ